MSFEIILSRNGRRHVLEVISETFKNLKVWKVKFQDGGEAILYKCGSIWLQRNEDELEHGLLSAIGEKIDLISLGLSFS